MALDIYYKEDILHAAQAVALALVQAYKGACRVLDLAGVPAEHVARALLKEQHEAALVGLVAMCVSHGIGVDALPPVLAEIVPIVNGAKGKLPPGS